MHAMSRDSVRKLQARFEDLTSGLDAAALRKLADELAGVAGLLESERQLRKVLTARTDEPDSKVALVDSLFSGRVGDTTLSLVKSAISERWSTGRDLAEAMKRCARLAILVDADHAGQIENVEDELFRFGRTLDSHARLSALLSDHLTPIDGRRRLLDDVLGGQPTEYTQRLLQQTLTLLRGRNIDIVVPELVDLAADLRGGSVAHVVAAAPLSDAQQDRLATILSRIYGRTISVQLEYDEDVLGGLRISVGDEVIDGTVASRLMAAGQHVPR